MRLSCVIMGYVSSRLKTIDKFWEMGKRIFASNEAVLTCGKLPMPNLAHFN